MMVTLDPHAMALGEKTGARIVTDGAQDGHTGSVNAGRRLLAREGRGGMITMPGDIPAVRAGEIDAVLSAHLAAPSFTISHPMRSFARRRSRSRFASATTATSRTLTPHVVRASSRL